MFTVMSPPHTPSFHRPQGHLESGGLRATCGDAGAEPGNSPSSSIQPLPHLFTNNPAPAPGGGGRVQPDLRALRGSQLIASLLASTSAKSAAVTAPVLGGFGGGKGSGMAASELGGIYGGAPETNLLAPHLPQGGLEAAGLSRAHPFGSGSSSSGPKDMLGVEGQAKTLNDLNVGNQDLAQLLQQQMPGSWDTGGGSSGGPRNSLAAGWPLTSPALPALAATATATGSQLLQQLAARGADAGAWLPPQQQGPAASYAGQGPMALQMQQMQQQMMMLMIQQQQQQQQMLVQLLLLQGGQGQGRDVGQAQAQAQGQADTFMQCGDASAHQPQVSSLQGVELVGSLGLAWVQVRV